MEVAGIHARESPYLDRYVQIGVASGRIVSVSFPKTPDEDVTEDHELLDRIFAYLEGAEDDFTDVQIALTVPTKTRDVLEAVREVPYGEQVTVEFLTRRVPDLDPDVDDDVQLVRSALADNPVPLVIPDHRVRDGPCAAPPPVEQKLRSLEGI